MARRTGGDDDDVVLADVVEARRVFVGVRLPGDVVAALAAHVEEQRPHLRGVGWVDRRDWHVTLRFLGRVEDVHLVAMRLRSVSELAPFPVRLAGGGAFPSWPNARSVWVGVDKGGDRLTRAARAVQTALGDSGVPRAIQRPFIPHVTVARAQPGVDARGFLGRLGNDPVGEAFPVDEITLFESLARTSGRRYVPLAVVPLRGR